jgi:REP element-mobilizing transposase RayT
MIVEDDTDRERFVETLREASRRAGWLVHAYVLMGNHYHLVVETPQPNLVRGMTWFQTTYTVRYNARHRTTGHLFGGRYKAILVEAGEGASAGDAQYFSTLLDYIHLNPVRAGLVLAESEELPDVAGYPWSSLPHYCSKPSSRPEFLATSRGFHAFGLKDGPAGRRRFVERIALRAQGEEAVRCGLAEIDGQGLQSTLRRGWCYGSATFRENMLGLAEDLLKRRSSKRDRNKNYRGAELNDHGEKQAEKIIAAGLEVFGLEEGQLPGMKKSADEKVLIAAIVRELTAVKVAWLATRLEMGSKSNVTRASSTVSTRLATDKALRRARKKILATMSS